MKKHETVCAALLLIALAVACGGCASTVLEHASARYSEAYGDIVNRQMLLNLARLSHNEPAHFIQLGTFTANYKFSAGAGFAPSHVRQTTRAADAVSDAIQETLTLGGTLAAGAEESPSFQFLPLSGNIFTKAVYTPVAPSVFLALLDQNYPADWLMRLLVSEVTVSDSTNTEHAEVYVNNPRAPSYEKFLSFCYDLSRMKASRAVEVRTIERTVVSATCSDLKTRDILDATAAGFDVANQAGSGTNTYSLTRKSREAVLCYNPEWSTLRNTGTDANDPRKKQIGQVLVDYGLVKRDGQGNLVDNRETNLLEKFRFKFRTFESVMYFAAKEEDFFKRNLESQKAAASQGRLVEFRECDADGYSVALLGKSDSRGLEFLFRPLLSLKAPRKDLTALVALDYRGETYVIGDREVPECYDRPWQNQNRTLFTILCYLFAQVSIDTEKLPLQQMIQTR
jgi:hypothetical protein